MKVNLPTRIVVDDYHEFDTIATHFRRVLPGVKVREIAFNRKGYTGIVYTGNLKSPKNAALVTKLQKEMDAYERNPY